MKPTTITRNHLVRIGDKNTNATLRHYKLKCGCKVQVTEFEGEYAGATSCVLTTCIKHSRTKKARDTVRVRDVLEMERELHARGMGLVQLLPA